jgi:cyclopropane-fatty-acyl-phospholipid synthase
MTEPTSERPGASARAIQHHYDVSNEFFALWLDETMTYSCALWEGLEDRSDLATAQRRKIDHHVRAAGAASAGAVLDVGCGWGSVLRELVTARGVGRAVGLTLSAAQAEHVRSLDLPGVEVRLESWADHAPERPYDAVISIGAFEHFAGPDCSTGQKIQVYRDFFARCRSWLASHGRLSLQTIAYGTMQPEEASAFMQNEIFPQSDLPRLSEIVSAADGLFEIVSLRNDRIDYARTCDLWLARLRAGRAAALALVGEEVFARYEHYLKLSTVGFRMGRICLLRMAMRPIASDRARAITLNP